MKQKTQNIIYLITFLAGFSFLIFEVSWNRYLSLILGTTVKASTIVLMSFMSGFGIGALFLSKKVNKYKQKKRFLSFILALIGLMSLINYFIFENGISKFYGLFTNLLFADFVFFAISFLLLFIPAFFMGGVIPTISSLIISDNKNIEKKLGNIYAFETLGSTLGGLIAGFILLGNLGQKESIFIAVTINILIAVFLFFSKKSDLQQKNNIEKNKNTISLKANSHKSAKIAKIAAFLFGFSILGLQIIWIRIFKTYFTNTSYTFTLITSFVILGLSIGSWIYKKRGKNIKNNDNFIIKLLISLLVVISIGLLILYKLPEFLMFPFKEHMNNQIFRLLLIPVFASLLIVFPPSLISGFAFPLNCNMYSDGAKNIGKNVGYILMLNTVGSFLGPAFATFVLIPFLGTGKSILIIIFLLLLLIIYFAKIIKQNNKFNKYKIVFITISAFVLIFIVFADKIKFVPPSIKRYDKKIIYYNETIEGTLTIVNEKEKGIFGKSTFVNNSSVIGSNYDAIKAVKMIGHIPFFAGLEAKKVLVIGFGIGVTTSAIASHNQVEIIDCVELVPGLVKSANYYTEFNQAVYNDPRLNIIPGDGRHFLQLTSNKYDLISCDPTHPVLGSGNLYTQDYFKQCYNHLTKNGMISQYLPLHKLRKKDLLGIIKTFNSVFPQSYLWLGQYHGILIGKKNKGKINFANWKKIVNSMPNDDFFYFEPYHIASSVILDSKTIKKISKNCKINKDNLNYTEFFSFKSFNSDNIFLNLKFLSENRCNIKNVFSKIDNIEKMKRYRKGNIKLTKSLYFSLQGKYKKALKTLQKASEINPENQEYPFLLKFYYGIEN